LLATLYEAPVCLFPMGFSSLAALRGLVGAGAGIDSGLTRSALLACGRPLGIQTTDNRLMSIVALFFESTPLCEVLRAAIGRVIRSLV
jgi:hypothetical protein